MVDLLESNVNAHKKLVNGPSGSAGGGKAEAGAATVAAAAGATSCAIVIFLPMMKEDSYNCIFKRSVIPQVSYCDTLSGDTQSQYQISLLHLSKIV